jgi:hypothetical protein
VSSSPRIRPSSTWSSGFAFASWRLPYAELPFDQMLSALTARIASHEDREAERVGDGKRRI